MTREEIIEQLNLAIGLIKQDGKDWLDDRDVPMLEECVKALEQEPCRYWQNGKCNGTIEPCEDAVSRQAVLDIVCGTYEKDGWGESNFYKAIKKLPSVTQKSGKWILQPSNKEQGERDFIWWKCSKCGHVIFSETERDRQEYHAFCGRCGAKMESEEV